MKFLSLCAGIEAATVTAPRIHHPLWPHVCRAPRDPKQISFA